MHSNAFWVVAACLDEIENGVVNSCAKAEVIGMEQRWRSALRPMSGAEPRSAAPNQGIENVGVNTKTAVRRMGCIHAPRIKGSRAQTLRFTAYWSTSQRRAKRLPPVSSRKVTKAWPT